MLRRLWYGVLLDLVDLSVWFIINWIMFEVLLVVVLIKVLEMLLSFWMVIWCCEVLCFLFWMENDCGSCLGFLVVLFLIGIVFFFFWFVLLILLVLVWINCMMRVDIGWIFVLFISLKVFVFFLSGSFFNEFKILLKMFFCCLGFSRKICESIFIVIKWSLLNFCVLMMEFFFVCVVFIKMSCEVVNLSVFVIVFEVLMDEIKVVMIENSFW